ncbi:4Fe-4S binding protein [candidate division KSB1 bacterium]|nr:4Fe-4S binding protein [candidate division KSB1 bacterium]
MRVHRPIRSGMLVLAVFFSLPLTLAGWGGLYIWSSPYLLLNRLISTQTLYWFALLGVASLVLVALRHRWFCRYLCAPGTMCRYVSRFGLNKRALNRFPRLGSGLFMVAIALSMLGFPVLIFLDPVVMWKSFFDGLAVHQDATFVVLKSLGLFAILLISALFPHLWCARLCPLGGLQDVFSKVKRIFSQHRTAPEFHLRRSFVLMIGTVGVGLFAKSFFKSREHPMRPPGALPEDRFKVTCARCGNCVAACPTHILKPDCESDLSGLFTPVITFDKSYCLPDCVRCGSKCPSGAITPFSRQKKSELKIGIARLVFDKCLLAQNSECDRCKFYCEFDAIKIEISDGGISARPVISHAKCVGCGACKIACPADALDIVAAI